MQILILVLIVFIASCTGGKSRTATNDVNSQSKDNGEGAGGGLNLTGMSKTVADNLVSDMESTATKTEGAKTAFAEHKKTFEAALEKGIIDAELDDSSDFILLADHILENVFENMKELASSLTDVEKTELISAISGSLTASMEEFSDKLKKESMDAGFTTRETVVKHTSMYSTMALKSLAVSDLYTYSKSLVRGIQEHLAMAKVSDLNLAI